ncbi:MAG: peptidylprolyl isomerase [Rickettsiales bacterium]|jgi:hypothetical protein|nr:peptidylprolyl isomerase [Rickettsiales bacterium]
MKFQVKSIAVKTLLIFISVSFILFGVINYLDSISDNHIMKIGGKQITFNNFLSFLGNKKNQIMQNNPGQDESIFDSKDFVKIGLQEYMNELLLMSEVEKLNLKTPKSIIYKTILDSDSFKDQNGKFDLDIYKNSLSKNGIPEDLYIETLSLNNGRVALLQTLTLNKLNNKFIADKFFKFKNRYFVVDVFSIPVDKIDVDYKNITDDDIKNYYKNNRFDIPEKRIIAYIDIDLTKTKETADSLRDLVLSSDGIREIANKFNLKVNTTDSKPKDVSDEFMGYVEGTFSDLINKKDNIYRVYYMEKVEPPKILTLNEATPIIKRTLLQKQRDESSIILVNNIINDMKNGKKNKIVRTDKSNFVLYDNSLDFTEDELEKIFTIKRENTFSEAFLDSSKKMYKFILVKNIKNIDKNNNRYISQDDAIKMLANSYNYSTMALFQNYLIKTNKIVINNKMFNKLLE